MERPKRDRKQLIDELKIQWRTLWRDRINDKVRAESIANMDYSLLLIERGTVIIASRDYKPLDLYEILEKQRVRNADNVVPPNPSIGGWRKFIRSVLRKQRFIKRERPIQPEPNREKDQQQKKGRRGWLHIRM